MESTDQVKHCSHQLNDDKMIAILKHTSCAWDILVNWNGSSHPGNFVDLQMIVWLKHSILGKIT